MIRQRALLAIQRRKNLILACTAKSTSVFFNALRHYSAVLAAVLLCATTAQAASISYGNFPVPGSGIMFLDVKESSGTDPVPLYGPPDPFVVGLDFDPAGFVATASGGGADITDGQLNFTVMGGVNASGNDVGINSISLFENGDYTLAGIGTAATQAIAGAIISAKVTHIDGLLLPTPINLSPSNASVSFNLAANPGVVQPWSLGVFLNVVGQLPPGSRIGATKVEVVINNQLLAFSEPQSLSFIAKKDFRIDLVPGVIPEPSTLVLIGVAIVLMGCAAKQRRDVAA